jgi:hypothetical protein
MGMSLTGTEGGAFDASVWSWRPIHSLCEHVNRLFSLGLTIDGWEYNDGNGLKTQGECDRLAMGIQEFIDNDWPKGKQVMTIECSGGPEIALMQQLSGQGMEVKTPAVYSIKLPHLLEFVDFLKKCGGFKIW